MIAAGLSPRIELFGHLGDLALLLYDPIPVVFSTTQYRSCCSTTTSTSEST
jgi:hypothetical protein